MYILLSILFFFVFAQSSLAITGYVDPGATGCGSSSTTYDDVTRTCGSGSKVMRNSVSGFASAHVAGDTWIFRGGTYTDNWIDNIKSGTGPGFTGSTTIQAYPGETPLLKPNSTSPGGICIFYIENKHSIIIDGFELNGLGCTGGGAPIYIRNLTGMPSYIRFQNNHVHDAYSVDGMLVACDFCEILNNEIDHNGLFQNPTPPNPHGIYYKAGQFPVIRGNNIHHNAQYGMQVYPDATNDLIEYNWFHENGVLGKSGELETTGDTSIIRYNSFGCSDPSTVEIGIQIQYGNTAKRNVKMYNNSIYNCRIGILTVSGGTGMQIKNNVILGAATPISDGATGTTLTTNTTSGTASSYWVDPTNFDLRLKSGSPAIDAGTDLGEGFVGSGKDRGAFEMPVQTSASINTNQIDITFGVVNGPMIPSSGATGWTISCTGASTCPSSYSVSNVNQVSGSLTKIRLIISGLTGNACQAGEVWTASFSSVSGTVTDFINVGSVFNQPIQSFSSFAITNNCSGSGGSAPPSSPVLYYNMNNNVLDTSGFSRHGTVVGSAVFTNAGFRDQGIQTHAGLSEYVHSPYGTNFNPYTNSISVCVSVYLTPGTQNTASLFAFGTPVGTNRRFYVAVAGGSWGAGVQDTNSGGTSDLTAVAGWNRVCLISNSGTHIVKLSLNGVFGTTGDAVKTITSYTFAGDFDVGILSGNQAGNAIYDEFKIWESAIDPAVDFASYGSGGSASGQFSQPTHIFEAVYLNSGSVVSLGATGAAQDVVQAGGVAVQFQINCDNVADCSATSFAIYYSTDCTNFISVVPDVAGGTGVSFWGTGSAAPLNNGVADGPLTGALTHTDGSTMVLSTSPASYDLAQNTSLTIRGIFKFTSGIADGSTVCFRVQEANGAAFTGGYTPSYGAKVNIRPSAWTFF